MTVTLAGTPGDIAGWESAGFTATVNGTTALIYARTQDMHLDSDSPYFTIDTPSEQSVLKFTYDEPVTVVIAFTDPITSYVFYPTREDITASIAGGELTLTLPVDADGIDLFVAVNGDRQNPLHLIAQPPLDGIVTLDINEAPSFIDWTDFGTKTVSSIDTTANTITTSSAHGWSAGQKVHFYSAGTYPTAVGGDIDDLTVYYVESAPTTTSVKLSRTSGGVAIDLTSAGSGSRSLIQASYTSSTVALYFGPGLHRTGMHFFVGEDTEVYFDHGALVVGSFDLRGTNGAYIHGPGVLSGTFSPSVSGEAFATIMSRSMFYGNNGSQFYFDNKVEGLTVLASPSVFTFYGLWSLRYVQHISPWEANTDGPDLRSRAVDNQVSEFYRLYSYTGDDAIHIDTGAGTTTVDKSFLITSANGSPFLMSYTYDLITDINGTEWSVKVNDCHAMTLAGPDPDTFSVWPYRGFTSIFKAWIDGPSSQTGRWDVEFNRTQVWGPLNSRPCSLRNLPFEFVGAANGKGQLANIRFNDTTFHEVPGQLGEIAGLDVLNSPKGIHWKRLRIGGVPVSASTFLDYFVTDDYATGITVDGKAIA